VIGVDENRNVPVLTGDDADLAARDTAQARLNAENAMDVDDDASSLSSVEKAPVKLVVLDGIVMGPPHCAWDNCTQDLANSRRGVFCVEHDIIQNGLCRICDCGNPKGAHGQTCDEHQDRWNSYIL
jgi:hypothetical protein